MIRLRPRLAAPAIVNIGSVSAYTVSTNRGDYCVSKAGLQMVTQLFAARLAEFDILVYEICPGIIDTDMTAAKKSDYDRLISEGLTPQRRWGSAADVGKAVAALASGQFSFSTGAVIPVDGGFHIRRL
jgi:NAD(P)-dependent dehydrogenase (short-subunit alcohol dehydrogenase family)